MFTIQNKRKQFWQWDTGQRLIVNADVCSEVHFCNGTSDCSYVCEVYEEDGIRLVNVPNILLQESKAIRVYAYICEENDHHTHREMIFPVFPRSKPEDYVYTETEIKRYSDLEKDIAELGDYVHKHESLGITGATVGQTVKITEVDENGKPVKWEAVEMASGGASSWNDLTDKPFGSGIGKLDIIPEQQVTFSDGVAQCKNVKDPCYDLGLVTDPGTMTAYLEINGEVIEGEINYRYAAAGMFGSYDFTYNRITLQDGATVQDGETVTVRLYAIAEVVETLDPKFLPKNAAHAVSYDYGQNLDESQKGYARRNIDATKTGLRGVLSLGNYELTSEPQTITVEKDTYPTPSFYLLTIEFKGKPNTYSDFKRISRTTLFMENTDYLQEYAISVKYNNETINYRLYVKFDGWNISTIYLDGENTQIKVVLQDMDGLEADRLY